MPTSTGKKEQLMRVHTRKQSHFHDDQQRVFGISNISYYTWVDMTIYFTSSATNLWPKYYSHGYCTIYPLWSIMYAALIINRAYPTR